MWPLPGDHRRFVWTWKWKYKEVSDHKFIQRYADLNKKQIILTWHCERLQQYYQNFVHDTIIFHEVNGPTVPKSKSPIEIVESYVHVHKTQKCMNHIIYKHTYFFRQPR